MRILAVIPARAGSKGIPNKNIRIIGGQPLVRYAIKNALASCYVTDVIVTTDSQEVKIIAQQMGAAVRWRDSRLCGDDVTLDAVVYDAAEDPGRWDYIVTMQPTSPTLKVGTLDAAIGYAVKEGLDTLISAINAPHLSWRNQDGRRVPNYKERLNRQYLPACFLETGAFVISKGSVVSERTRIGEKVDVFEVSEEESIDVDTFSDLRAAASILDRKKAAFYVNGNNQRGMGHIYRVLELADEFDSKPDIYYDKNQTDPAAFGNTMHRLIAVDGIAELFTRCKTEQYDIFINDILDTSVDYMIGLRSVLPTSKIINFEDDGEGITKADLVFNALYGTSEDPRVKYGAKYYIAPKGFLFYEPIPIREQVKRVFISFGGADPRHYTERLLRILDQECYASFRFVVVLGRAKENAQMLLQENSRYGNVEILYDVGNMPELMSSCDIGITSRGRTGYELAMLGIPTIAMAQNKREEKHTFVSGENGFSYIGLDPPDEVIEATLKMYLSMSRASRQDFQRKLLAQDLKNGRSRVMSLING